MIEREGTDEAERKSDDKPRENCDCSDGASSDETATLEEDGVSLAKGAVTRELELD
jgi:hypothetical protein